VWRASAAASSAFDGTHPVFTQVPPVVPRSTITTRLPLLVAAMAAANAAEPEPMTARSKPDSVVVTVSPRPEPRMPAVAMRLAEYVSATILCG
jgi:hypothetical protein